MLQDKKDMSEITQHDINKIIYDVMFKDGTLLYRHNFESFENCIKILIPSILNKRQNIVSYLDPNNNKRKITIFIHGTDIKIIPPKDNEGNILYPLRAIREKASYIGYLEVTFIQQVEAEDLLTHEIELLNQYKKTSIKQIEIFIMVGSEYCNYTIEKNVPIDYRMCNMDPGGYFIVKGTPRTLLSIESLMPNKVIVYSKSVPNKTLNKSGMIYIAKVQSEANDINSISYNQMVNITVKHDNVLIISYPHFKDGINLVTFLHALGMETTKEIITTIIPYEEYTSQYYRMLDVLMSTINNAHNEQNEYNNSTYDAKLYLTTKLTTYYDFSQDSNEKLQQKLHYLEKMLKKDFLPHIEQDEHAKAIFLCYMAKRLIKVKVGLASTDNRDSYINKRVETPGILIAKTINASYNKIIKEMKALAKKQLDNRENQNYILKINFYVRMEQELQKFLTIGANSGSNRDLNISQLVGYTNYLETIYNLRRIKKVGIDETSKLTGPRQVDPSQVHIACSTQFSEGSRIGLEDNMCNNQTISPLDIMSKPKIKTFLQTFKNILSTKSKLYMFEIILDGVIYGYIEDVKELFTRLKTLKHTFQISPYTGIMIDFDELQLKISTCQGRFITVMLCVDKNTMKLALTKDMINDITHKPLDFKIDNIDTFMLKYPGVLEYVSAEESTYNVVAPKIDYVMRELDKKNNSLQQLELHNKLYTIYNYCLLHPSLTIGILCGNSPFTNMNQAPRNSYAGSQSKQAAGFATTNMHSTFVNSFYATNPQNPVVSTMNSKICGNNKMTNGENIIVAIAAYTGNNQEDSIIMNKDSLEQGKFTAIVTKKYSSEIEKNHMTSQDDKFMKPDTSEINGRKDVNYSKLCEGGYAPPETKISVGDVLICKVSPSNNSKHVYDPTCEIYKSQVPATVNKVEKGITNQSGYGLINMEVRSYRPPIIGDKFASRHAQKGTLGLILPSRLMPQTRNGMTPDFIINPNCIPSRMTLGQTVEMLTSKIGGLVGEFIDGTPFEKIDIDAITAHLANIIHKYKIEGMDEFGHEEMYSGFTGEKFKVNIFIGPCYYCRLKHMVQDKAHARSIGSTNNLTRQPPEGRRVDGGLRVGEMEVHAIVAHGLAGFLKERMNECSDFYECHICDFCGDILPKAKNVNRWICNKCKNYEYTTKVQMPYTTKLMHQELKAMHINTSFKTPNTITNKQPHI